MRLTSAGVALFIQLAVIQVKRGANIELTLSGNYVNGNLVECNSNATLMCTAGAATNSMSWHRNGTKIGDCTAGFCLPDPSVSNIYGFVFDKPNGVFNISAEPVTNADANAIFECTIGSATKLLTLNVTGNFRILPSTKTVSSNITELNISTGCVDKNVVVQFHWSIINAFNQTDIKELPKSYQVLNSTSSCLSDLYCGGIDKEKKISILAIKEEENTADSYFIAVTVTYEQYPNKSREFQFKEGPFKITGTSKSGKAFCFPCWAFGVILEGVTCISIAVVCTVKALYFDGKRNLYVLEAIVISIVIIAHIVVILVSRYTDCENEVDEKSCLPCWAYWTIQIGIVVGTLTCTFFVKVISGNSKISLWCRITFVVFGVAAHISIVLAAKFCIMKHNNEVNTCMPCWALGVILAAIAMITILCVCLMKVCCPDGKHGSIWYWEMSAVSAFFIVIIYLVVIIIVSGFIEDCDEISGKSFSCWKIYLIIFGILVVCVTISLFVYVVCEPVIEVKVASRKMEDKHMTIKFRLESRLVEFKTFYIQLECRENILKPTQLNHTLSKEGIAECELTGLQLDTNYKAYIFSSLCKLKSVSAQIAFDTKGRPVTPTEFHQEEHMRTEDSITLSWKQGKGSKTCVIMFKRSKQVRSEWKTIDKIDRSWYTIDGLRPGTSYTIILHAENDVGRSEGTEPLRVKTRALKPTPPKDFKCISCTENEVQLSWKPYANIKKQRFMLTVYDISDEVPTGHAQNEQEISIEYKGEKTMTHTVSNLAPGCKYMFELFTLAGKLFSDRSAIVTVETKESHNAHSITDEKLSIATTVFHFTQKR